MQERQEQHERRRRVAEGAGPARVVDYPTAERYSGLSHTTLWRYVISGELKAARVGRSVRIHLPSLREFMEEKARGTGKQRAGH
jgi:excisionase family DNA binding protein